MTKEHVNYPDNKLTLESLLTISRQRAKIIDVFHNRSQELHKFLVKNNYLQVLSKIQKIEEENPIILGKDP